MLLRPDLMVEAAYDVSPGLLRRYGRHALMVDLDDTVIASNSEAMAPPYLRWFDDLAAAGLSVVILSNGQPTRVRRWADTLGVDGFALVGKPFRFAFRRGLRRLGSKPSETAMIGDQLFTDVLGANLAGLMSILVRPLTAGILPHTRIARRFENMILRRR